MARFISIDSSTNSFAFAIWEEQELINYGKINFYGEKPLDKALDAARKVYALMVELEIDYVVIESAIFANSANVALSLGISQGAVLGACRLAGATHIYSVPPITWQSYIGNKNFTKAEKLQIRRDHPGKSTTWYRAFERGIRKQKTIDFVNKMYKLEIDDNDIADSIGIGYYSHNALFSLRPKPVKRKEPVKKRSYTKRKSTNVQVKGVVDKKIRK